MSLGLAYTPCIHLHSLVRHVIVQHAQGFLPHPSPGSEPITNYTTNS